MDQAPRNSEESSDLKCGSKSIPSNHEFALKMQHDSSDGKNFTAKEETKPSTDIRFANDVPFQS